MPLLVLVSCRRHSGERKPVEVTITEKSNLFNEELVELTVDSANNFLYLNLAFNYKALQKFPFPKYENNEALTGTAFQFGLYTKGQLIEGIHLDNKKSNNNYFGYNKWLGDHFSFYSDTIDFRNGQNISFEIPLYAFGKLKAGLHEIELKISQEIFCSPFKFSKFMHVDSLGDSIYSTIRNSIRSPLLYCSAKFKISIPKIFKSTVYGYGIELRNDSVYSPAGMDNTIWNSSYPDVYWTISFPADNFYCSSDYQKSTSLYDAKDTFFLYHYTPHDSISIGVWDHDNLSRDDYISYRNFSVNQFPQGEKVSFSYGNLKSIELRMDKHGYINP